MLLSWFRPKRAVVNQSDSESESDHSGRQHSNNNDNDMNKQNNDDKNDENADQKKKNKNNTNAFKSRGQSQRGLLRAISLRSSGSSLDLNDPRRLQAFAAQHNIDENAAAAAGFDLAMGGIDLLGDEDVGAYDNYGRPMTESEREDAARQRRLARNTHNNHQDGSFEKSWDGVTGWHYFLRVIFSWASCCYFAGHAAREARKRKFQFCLGTMSVFLVVIVAAVSYTMLAKAPVVFLQQAEANSGQMDMFLSSDDQFYFLNYTQLRRNAEVADQEFSYSSPRNTLFSRIYPKACTDKIDNTAVNQSEVVWRYQGQPGLNLPCARRTQYCIQYLCTDELSIVSWVINTERERRMGLGRSWQHGPIPRGQVAISDDLAVKLNLTVGDTMWGINHYSRFTRPYWQQAVRDSESRLGLNPNSTAKLVREIDRFYHVVTPMTIFAIGTNGFGGKLPVGDSTMVFEASEMNQWLLDNMHPELAKFRVDRMDPSLPQLSLRDIVLSINPEEYSRHTALNMPPGRTDVYASTDYPTVQRKLVNFASRAMYYLGFPMMETSLGVLDEMGLIRFFTLFLGLILSIILTILFILSSMLIYSLLLISVETRTFELGVHRMVGMSRFGIITMLLMQAVSYAMPAWMMGLGLAQYLVHSILSDLEESVEIPISKGLTSDSVAIATVLGLLIPVLSALLPIRNALNQNIHDALDIKHSKTQAVKITLERSEDDQLSSAWVVLGLGLLIFGFLIYYLLPLSLLSFNLTLFFNIFFGILLGMLFGLILLSLNFEHLVERLVVTFTLWWEARSTRMVVLKNLTAHRLRNRKTTIMYALALGFIIFIVVSYRMELKTAELRTLKGAGAPMYIDGPISYWQLYDIQRLTRESPAVEDIAWVTERTQERVGATDAYLTTPGQIKSGEINIVAASPNFFDVALSDDFLIAEKQRQDTGLSLSEQIYTMRGSQSVLMASGYRDTHYLKTLDSESKFLMKVEVLPDPSRNVEGQLNISSHKPLAQLDSAPFFTMSRQNTEGFRNNDIVVNLPTYIAMTQGRVSSVKDVTFQRVLFKLAPGATDEQLDALVVDFIEQMGATVWDFRDLKTTLDKTDLVMTLIFSIATYIAMGLCLFSLMASMYTNIYEQSKEIGVLRAMGMRRGQIVRIFVYEGYVLVLASSILGIMIGCIMAWTMQAQRVLFTQLPVPILFPYEMLILVVIGAVLCSLIASCGPSRALVKKETAQIMRTLL